MKMKFANILILFIISGIIFYGCDNPAPTQLVQDSQNQGQVKVEVVAKDTSSSNYNNGFDTTGVTEQQLQYSNVITVSGTKVTNDEGTTETAFAQALFFDVSHPVKSPRGDTLGYLTLTPGIVMFNHITALKMPYKINLGNYGGQKDSVLGKQYLLIENMSMLNRLFFRYNSAINFQYFPMRGKAINFDIPTPSEITGNVKLTGKLSNKNLNAVIQWNQAGAGKVELIVGAITRGTEEKYPLYKIELQDNGILNLPQKLLNELPLKKYDKLVFTLVRKIELNNAEGNSDLYVLSQSVHSIIIDIP